MLGMLPKLGHTADTFCISLWPVLVQLPYVQCGICCLKLCLNVQISLNGLIADDTPTQTLEDPPIFLPVGPLWKGLEEFWSDLVIELPEIPYGGNEHYHNVMKPALSKLLHARQHV